MDADRPTPFDRFFFREPDGYVFEIVEAEHDRKPPRQDDVTRLRPPRSRLASPFRCGRVCRDDVRFVEDHSRDSAGEYSTGSAGVGKTCTSGRCDSTCRRWAASASM